MQAPPAALAASVLLPARKPCWFASQEKRLRVFSVVSVGFNRIKHNILIKGNS
jgi:hypothetical protein